MAPARSYRPERGPGAPWLYAVARNAIVDRCRGRGKPSPRCPRRAVDRHRPPEQRRDEVDAHGASIARSRSCSPTERQVIELAYWSGLSQSEVARVPRHSARHGEDADARALARLADLLEGGAGMTDSPTSAISSADELTAEERARLARIHELLVAAGPRPSCRPRCVERDSRRGATRPSVPAAPPGRRSLLGDRRGASRVAAFLGGYLARQRHGAVRPRSTRCRCTGPPQAAKARATIEVGEIDVGGQLAAARTRCRTCRRSAKGQYYEMFR